jgi:hypothetical protein
MFWLMSANHTVTDVVDVQDDQGVKGLHEVAHWS